MSFVNSIDFITSVISLWFFFSNFKKLGHSARYLVYYIFFLFYVLPLVLDYFVLKADYSYSIGYYGFIVSQSDKATRIIYDVLLLYTQYVILYHKRNANEIRIINFNEMKLGANIVNFLILFAILPTVGVIILMHQPEILYTFQWREMDLYNSTGSYSTIEKFSYLGVSCSCALLINGRRGLRNVFLKCLGLFFLFVNICIQGKRAILFFAVIVFFILFYFLYAKNITNKHKARKIAFISLLIAVVASIGMVVFSLTVKIGRGYNAAATDIFYTTTRVDILRDDRVRMSIFSKIHPDQMEILDYPGQSFLSDISAVVPINYLVSYLDIHNYSYQTHFTYALTKESKPVDGKLVVDGNSWMTVCFVSELISNCGIFGFLLVPFVFLMVAGWIDRARYPCNVFLTCGLVLLNMFDFVYIVLFWEVILVMVILSRKSYRN